MGRKKRKRKRKRPGQSTEAERWARLRSTSTSPLDHLLGLLYRLVPEDGVAWAKVLIIGGLAAVAGLGLASGQTRWSPTALQVILLVPLVVFIGMLIIVFFPKTLYVGGLCLLRLGGLLIGGGLPVVEFYVWAIVILLAIGADIYRHAAGRTFVEEESQE